MAVCTVQALEQFATTLSVRRPRALRRRQRSPGLLTEKGREVSRLVLLKAKVRHPARRVVAVRLPQERFEHTGPVLGVDKIERRAVESVLVPRSGQPVAVDAAEVL